MNPNNKPGVISGALEELPDPAPRLAFEMKKKIVNFDQLTIVQCIFILHTCTF